MFCDTLELRESFLARVSKESKTRFRNLKKYFAAKDQTAVPASKDSWVHPGFLEYQRRKLIEKIMDVIFDSRFSMKMGCMQLSITEKLKIRIKSNRFGNVDDYQQEGISDIIIDNFKKICKLFNNKKIHPEFYVDTCDNVIYLFHWEEVPARYWATDEPEYFCGAGDTYHYEFGKEKLVKDE